MHLTSLVSRPVHLSHPPDRSGLLMPHGVVAVTVPTFGASVILTGGTPVDRGRYCEASAVSGTVSTIVPSSLTFTKCLPFSVAAAAVTSGA